MNFMLFFIPAIALFPSQIKEIKHGKLNNGDSKPLLLGFCLLFFIDKCLINISYAIAPNPGYALAIFTSAVVLIASLKDKFVNITKENNIVTVSSVLLLALFMVYFINI